MRTRLTHAWAPAALLALSLAACGGADPVAAPRTVEIAGATSRTITVAVGSEIGVTLQTIGPGEYESPPSVSSQDVRYLDVALVSPHVPAGPTQRFRFQAVAPGRAVVGFHHTGMGRAVEHTILVQ